MMWCKKERKRKITLLDVLSGASRPRGSPRLGVVHLQVQVFIDATPKNHVVLGANAIHINSSAGTMVLRLPHSGPHSDAISSSLK